MGSAAFSVTVLRVFQKLLFLSSLSNRCNRAIYIGFRYKWLYRQLVNWFHFAGGMS
jgi:hypothetical protein